MNNIESFLVLVAISAFVIAIAFLVIIQIKAYGTALEDKGTSLKEQLLERAREWNIQKEINETLLIADRYTCFNDLNEYFKFRLEHDNDTDLKVEFPCPDLDISKLPKDESGK